MSSQASAWSVYAAIDESHKQQLQHRLRLATQEMDRARLDMANATESFLSAERRFNAVREALENISMRSSPTGSTQHTLDVDRAERRSIFDVPNNPGEPRDMVQVAEQEGAVKGKGKGKAVNIE